MKNISSAKCRFGVIAVLRDIETACAANAKPWLCKKLEQLLPLAAPERFIWLLTVHETRARQYARSAAFMPQKYCQPNSVQTRSVAFEILWPKVRAPIALVPFSNCIVRATGEGRGEIPTNHRSRIEGLNRPQSMFARKPVPLLGVCGEGSIEDAA
jgi:hypothetical protein